MSDSQKQSSTPRTGMLAGLRNRNGLITEVEPFSTKQQEGDVHFVRVEYTDFDAPQEEFVLWEREPYSYLREPRQLPEVEQTDPMRPEDFDALQRAVRWTALTPFLDPTDPSKVSELTFSAPFFGAIKADDFQLTPLVRALNMPRVALLIGDDVGLGKTVEAGLILSELLLRRRIRRVLILTPASLRDQWKSEMKDRFSLDFNVVDREATRDLQRDYGMDANPWRVYDRVIASYHYLRQPDVFESFRAASDQYTGSIGRASAQLPWDLLIVDEVHNLMPSRFGRDSQLATMLNELTPLFEHRLFLSATPHNGYTRSFTGLLQQLDPVRFTQKSELTDKEKQHLRHVVVRRLKSHINDQDRDSGQPQRFPERVLTSRSLPLKKGEQALSSGVADLRARIRKLVSAASRSEQTAGLFAIEVLSKRLLSCPYTFAESWHRLQAAVQANEAASSDDVALAKRTVSEDNDDDREQQAREKFASATIGGWLLDKTSEAETEINAVNQALDKLGLGSDSDTPKEDSRYDELVKLIEELLRANSQWREDERLVVFTEYKTTLDYLQRRLGEDYSQDQHRIEVLYGGMTRQHREAIKAAFNDPTAPVRVLVATDAASEGLNLQRTARYILHYDIPWNPSKLEQRNGRLDRHGQGRDVTVYHFASEEDMDLRFLGRVVDKIHNIREDLGALGQLFESAFERRFHDDQSVEEIEPRLDLAINRIREPLDLSGNDDDSNVTTSFMNRMKEELDLTPDHLAETLRRAILLSTGGDKNALDGPDEKGRYRLKPPLPLEFQQIVDDEVRLPAGFSNAGALPSLVFDPDALVTSDGGRPVFRDPPDTLLVHLGHPLYRKALSHLAQFRFPGVPGPGGGQSPSRWTVRYGHVRDGANALILVTVQERATNELREVFHDWVRTIVFPVRDGQIGSPLPHQSPSEDTVFSTQISTEDMDSAVDLVADNETALKRSLQVLSEERRSTIETVLAEKRDQQYRRTDAEYSQRIQEVGNARKRQSLDKLRRELDELREELRQNTLFEEVAQDKRLEAADLEEELKMREHNFDQLSKFLKDDRKRVLDELIPRRFTLRGLHIEPVTLEIRLPEA